MKALHSLFLAAALAPALLTLSAPAHAWGAQGHRLVAEIADTRLNPTAHLQHGRAGGCKRQKQNQSQMQDHILRRAIASGRWQLRRADAGFCLRLRARGKWKGEAGEGDGTVGAMDGAIEPPWMGCGGLMNLDTR